LERPLNSHFVPLLSLGQQLRDVVGAGWASERCGACGVGCGPRLSALSVLRLRLGLRLWLALGAWRG
jgi:hypothetical protein